MDSYCNRLRLAARGVEDPYEYIHQWIAEALRYVADGRHLLVKSLNSVSAPEFRRDEIAQGHRKLVATIIEPLQKLGFADFQLPLSYLQNTIDAASVRIDSGKEAELEIAHAQKYALAGLRALLS